MAIITVGLIETVYSSEKPWFQVIDDVNKNNSSLIEKLVLQADLVIQGNFSNPKSDESIYEQLSFVQVSIIQKVDMMCEKLKYNETQVRNFKLKCVNWMKNDFETIITCIDREKSEILLVVKSDKIKKHEWYYLQILNKLGVNILIITKDIDSLNSTQILYNDIKPNIVRYGTSENSSIDKLNKGLVENYTQLTYTKEYDNEVKDVLNLRECSCEYEEILNALNLHNKIVRASICGYRDDFDIPMLAAKCLEASMNDNDLILLNERIDKPTIDETSKIYKLNRDNVDYIISTVKGFIKVGNKDIEDKLKESLVIELSKLKNTNSSNIIYNKAVTIICWINRYIKNSNTEIVFYGEPKGNEELFLRIIFGVNKLTCVVLTPDINNGFCKDLKDLYIELDKTKNIVPLSAVAVNKAETLAYSASKRLNDTLYAEDSLGLYKNGQITYCETIHMACTFDEIPLWWNKEMYIRPGFKKEGSSAIIPIQFNVIRGSKNENNYEYKKMIQAYACGKTIIYYSPNLVKEPSNSDDGPFIHNCTDIKRTSFSEQQLYILNGKLQTELIKGSKNYKYKFLDVNKQNLILSKIQEIIDDSKLNIPKQYINAEKNLINTGTPFTLEYLDALLNMTLNLDIDTLRTIQWFNYTDYNPNIIVILENEKSITFMDAIYLRFMSKLGFDIMVFVPTSYTSIEQYIDSTEYETYDLGRPIYDLNIGNIDVKADAEYTQKVVEKKSFLSRLFSR